MKKEIRAIDADELKINMRYLDSESARGGFVSEYDIDTAKTITFKDLQPEVVYIVHDDGTVTCTCCERRMNKTVYGWPCCPNCGAKIKSKMTEEEYTAFGKEIALD